MNSNYDEVMKKVAHQWRQPLSEINSIVMVIASQLEDKNIYDEVIDKKLSEIEVLTSYMSKTIDDFNNLDKKNYDESFYVSSVINELVSIVSSNLKRNNIELIINLEDSFNYIGNSNILLQTMLVIVNNAKDALIERNVFGSKIILSVTKKEQFHVIGIVDNAGGMTKKMMEKIFDLNYSTKHKSQSSGIGLNMSKDMIKKEYDGELCVRNHGQGTCFEIKLKA